MGMDNYMSKRIKGSNDEWEIMGEAHKCYIANNYFTSKGFNAKSDCFAVKTLTKEDVQELYAIGRAMEMSKAVRDAMMPIQNKSSIVLGATQDEFLDYKVQEVIQFAESVLDEDFDKYEIEYSANW